MRNYSDSFKLVRRGLATLAFCCFGISTVYAQTGGSESYVPFVEEGKIWYCGYWHPLENSPATFEDPLGNCIDCIFTNVWPYGDKWQDI